MTTRIGLLATCGDGLQPERADFGQPVVGDHLRNWLITDVRLGVLGWHKREVVLPAPRVG